MLEKNKLAHQAFPELFEAAQLRRDRLIGSIALAATVEIDDAREANPSTLMANVQEAALGNTEALGMVRRNVSTDIAERMFKAGHFTIVPLQRTDQGLEQDGLPLVSIHQNTLEHMPLNDVMRNRTYRELSNCYLFEEMDKAGVFETHDAVVLSATPTDTATRRDYNFFTDTDSLSIQYLKKTGGDSFIIETAMMAGKTAPNAERHDLPAIRKMLEDAGMDEDYFDENEALSLVILTRKTPGGGVHNIVERLDSIIGGTFFGERKYRQDYQAYRKVCQAREQKFSSVVTKVTNQLLADAHTFQKPYDAIERLNELSDLYCIERAVHDASVDTRVFGYEAAAHIEQARIAKELGDDFSAGMHMAFAKKTSNSNSCPFFRKSFIDSDPEDPPSSESNDADCEFISKKCPECGARNVKTVVRRISSKTKEIKGSCKCRKLVKG